MNTTIKLKGISKRGKDRINSHGNEFKLIEKTKKDYENPNAANLILVESLDNTWRGQKWLGWFEVDNDVEIVN